MRGLLLTGAVVAFLGAGGACKQQPRFTGPMKLGGQLVAAETLNEGHDAYMQYCYACHGENGDGAGPSAPGMRPPPRDFRTGTFKFGGVAAGELPNDADLIALVRNGLGGTPMLPWDVSERERAAVVQYLKTFSPRWKTETPGERVVPAAPDPWVGKDAAAVELGKRLYHLNGPGSEKDAAGNPKTFFLSCNTCHPSYLAQKDLTLEARRAGAARPELRPDMYRPALKDSEFVAGDHKLQILPIDFLFHPVKNGTSLEALYRTIAAGIGGTAMPNWSVIKPDDLWALVRYVKTLVDMRDSPDAVNLQAALHD